MTNETFITTDGDNDRLHAASSRPIATADTAAAENPWPLVLVEALSHRIRLESTDMVVLPPIETGLLSSAWPMPTPLTQDPDQAQLPAFFAVLAAVLVALLLPACMVTVGPIDTGLLPCA